MLNMTPKRMVRDVTVVDSVLLRSVRESDRTRDAREGDDGNGLAHEASEERFQTATCTL